MTYDARYRGAAMLGILYELKKLLFNKFFIISTAIVIAYCVFLGTSKIDQITMPVDKVKDFYATLSDSDEQKKELEAYLNDIVIDAFSANGQNIKGKYSDNLMTDYLIVYKAIEHLEYKNHIFEKDMITVIANAVKERNNAEKNGNRFYQDYYDKVISEYNSYKNISLINSDVTFQFFNAFYFSWESIILNFLVIAWTVFNTVCLFLCERQCGIYEMVVATCNGRRQLVLNKFISLAVMLFTLVLSISIWKLICLVSGFGITDIFASIQSVIEFQYCIYDVSIIETIIIFAFMKLISLILVMTATALISFKAKSVVLPLLISFTVFLGTTYSICFFSLSDSYQSANTMNVLATFLPMSLFYPKSYFLLFDYQNVAGYPVCRLLFCIIITLAIATVIFLLTFILCEKGKVKNALFRT